MAVTINSFCRVGKAGQISAVVDESVEYCGTNRLLKKCNNTWENAMRSVAQVLAVQRIADLLLERKAQLWINHDAPQRARLELAPQYYE